MAFWTFPRSKPGKLESPIPPLSRYGIIWKQGQVRCCSNDAAAKGLELVCDMRPGVPSDVVGDPTRLRQVIVNLLGNAIKFTDRGEVVLHVEAQGAEKRKRKVISLHFAIQDSGIGISKDKQKLIFEAFAQADSSSRRKYGGTGLGLTISMRFGCAK